MPVLTVKETLLSASDSTHNSQLLASYEISSELQTFLEDYTDENNITLRNLLNAETRVFDAIVDELKLRDIKDEAVRKRFTDKLNVWKNTLQNAVYRSGALAALHNSPKNIGIADHVRARHAVSLTHWGTDLDIKQCLGSDIIDPKNICDAGTYVLAPNVLFVQAGSTVAEESMKSVLQEVIKSLEATHANQRIKLLIPVNCGNSHWRLAKIQIENKAIQSAELWDSLSDTGSPLEAFDTLKKAVEVVAQREIPVTKVATGIQTNSYSCMDYIVQEIYSDRQIQNEITQAGNARDLRLAIAKQIVTGQPDLGATVAATLQILNDAPVVAIQHEVKNKFLEKLASESRKASQIKFDGFFARELQNLYDKNPCMKDAASENKLQQQAFDTAYAEFQKAENDTSSTPRP